MRRFVVMPVLGACLLTLASGAPTLAASHAVVTGHTVASGRSAASGRGVAVGPAVTASHTAAVSHTVYVGKNSQGEKLKFEVLHTASGLKFDPVYLLQTIRCPVTGTRLTIGNGFIGYRLPIKNGKFDATLNGLSERFRWSGTITSTGASGLEDMDIANFDHEGGLQDCGAGSLSWKAHAVAPGSTSNADASALANVAYMITFTKSADGSAHSSITH